MTTIRRAEARDAPRLLALFKEHAHFERATFDDNLDPQKLLAAIAGNPPRLNVWVACNADGAFGYASATIDYSTWDLAEFVHMDCLYLREGHRGSGAGAALLKAVRAFAQAKGLPQVQWQSPDWNTEAARFYVREGATTKNKVRFYLATRA